MKRFICHFSFIDSDKSLRQRPRLLASLRQRSFRETLVSSASLKNVWCSFFLSCRYLASAMCLHWVALDALLPKQRGIQVLSKTCPGAVQVVHPGVVAKPYIQELSKCCTDKSCKQLTRLADHQHVLPSDDKCHYKKCLDE